MEQNYKMHVRVNWVVIARRSEFIASLIYIFIGQDQVFNVLSWYIKMAIKQRLPCLLSPSVQLHEPTAA